MGRAPPAGYPAHRTPTGGGRWAGGRAAGRARARCPLPPRLSLKVRREAGGRQLRAQQGEMWSLREGGQGGGWRALRALRELSPRPAWGWPRRELLRLPEAGSRVYGHTTLNAPDLV